MLLPAPPHELRCRSLEVRVKRAPHLKGTGPYEPLGRAHSGALPASHSPCGLLSRATSTHAHGKGEGRAGHVTPPARPPRPCDATAGTRPPRHGGGEGAGESVVESVSVAVRHQCSTVPTGTVVLTLPARRRRCNSTRITPGVVEKTSPICREEAPCAASAAIRSRRAAAAA